MKLYLPSQRCPLGPLSFRSPNGDLLNMTWKDKCNQLVIFFSNPGLLLISHVLKIWKLKTNFILEHTFDCSVCTPAEAPRMNSGHLSQSSCSVSLLILWI